MNLFGVTMVKDEIDVIEYTLRHLEGQGVDFIFVADNGSTDGTRELLDALEQVIPIKVIDDPEVGYYQSRKMTELVFQARQGGADYVLPFDADECWCSARGSLKEAFQRHANGGHVVLGAELYNHFPTSKDDPAELNPFKRITYRDRAPAPLPKVAVKALHGVIIHQGNHGAETPTGDPITPSTLRVAHFPWRSFEQFAKKVRNGAAAYAATDLPEETGAHWRSYGRILNEFGEEALRTDVWDQWFFDPPMRLVLDPVPYSG